MAHGLVSTFTTLCNHRCDLLSTPTLSLHPWASPPERVVGMGSWHGWRRPGLRGSSATVSCRGSRRGGHRAWGPRGLGAPMGRCPPAAAPSRGGGRGRQCVQSPCPQPPMPPPPGGSLVRGLYWQRGPLEAGVCGLGDPQRHTQAPCSRGSEAPQMSTWCPITHRPPEPVSHEEHPGTGSRAGLEGRP